MNTTTEFLKMVLEISGVLFGLTFATITYAHQAVTTTYEYAKDLFIDVYTEYSKLILVPLGFCFVIAMKALYLNGPDAEGQRPYFNRLDAVLVFGFCVIFLKVRLDYYRSRGEIHTIFSTKMVPAKYGRIRAYFRYIKNLGLFTQTRILIGFFIILGYPIFIGFKKGLGSLDVNSTIVYLLSFLIIYVLLKIITFIPITTEMQKLQVKNSFAKDVVNESKINRKEEFKMLANYLFTRGIKEQSIINEKQTKYGLVYLDVLADQDKAEAWINIYHTLKASDIDIDRNGVFEYILKIINLLYESKNDIETFVLSNHITFENKRKENLFLRIRRDEMPALINATDFAASLKRMKNVIINEMFK
jgi:hypothetical protein